jgi:hypothetical protein
MKKIISTFVFTIAVLINALPAQADDIRDRIEHQRAVIERGVESGTLTIRDARKLREEHREIRDLARELDQAGISRRERRHVLDKRLDRIDQKLRNSLNEEDYRPRHDGRYRARPDESEPAFNHADEMQRRTWER